MDHPMPKMYIFQSDISWDDRHNAERNNYSHGLCNDSKQDDNTDYKIVCLLGIKCIYNTQLSHNPYQVFPRAMLVL